MVDPSSFGALLGILQPEIMLLANIVIYIALILFFGSIAILGYKGYLSGLMHFLLRMGSGFICTVTGIGIAPFLPIVNEPIWRMSLMDVVIGGIISSIVLLISFYIITLRFSRSTIINKKIEVLKERLAKTRERPPSPRKLDPFKITGAVIFLAFLAISLMNFTGFPTMNDRIFSQLGITPEQLSQLAGLLGGGTVGTNNTGGGLGGLLPEGVVIEGGKPLNEQSQECMSAMLTLAGMRAQLENPEFLMNYTYSNAAIKSMIEGESGKTVVQMFRFTGGGKEVIMAITDDMFSCTAIPTELCLCAGRSS